jgi:CRISPR-associated endoribonuclease Cas6
MINLLNIEKKLSIKMRALISIRKLSIEPLPYDYQYALASMLYNKLSIGNIKLANESHSAQRFKFYNFSNLIINNPNTDGRGLDFEEAKFIITSPDVEFVKSFAEGLLQEPDFRLKDGKFVVTKIEILKERKIKSPCTFRTLSPIFVKTARDVEGKLKEWDLYPKDGKFYDNIHMNLVARYTEYYGETPRDYFEIIEIKNFKPKRIIMGGGPGKTPRRCSLMTFTVTGSEELLQFAYEAGIGEKNAMGFGCLEILEVK